MAPRARLAVLCIPLGLALVLAGRVLVMGQAGAGWVVRWDDGRAVVVHVDDGGAAARVGVHDGDVVVTIDSRPPSPDDGAALADGRFGQADVMSAENARALSDRGVVGDYVGTVSLPDRSQVDQGSVTAIGWALLVVAAAVALGRRRPSERWRTGGIVAVAVAVATPLLLATTWQLGGAPGAAAVWLVGLLSVLPLTAVLVGEMGPTVRRPAIALVVAASGIAAAIGLVALATGTALLPSGSAWPLIPAIPALAGGLTVASMARSRGRVDADRLPEITIGVMAISPFIAWLSVRMSVGVGIQPWPIILWVAVVGTVAWFLVRPLVRRAERTRIERDAMVSALERERARIAADIHDDVLQEMSMLGRRLDAAEDHESAGQVRDLADRLRAICYDLRLPILEDFGAGPALEWLVDRMDRSGGSVELERDDPVRLPVDVELAFYRVAQEALANAIKHGAPPVRVRFATSPGAGSLSVSDGGEDWPDPQATTRPGMGLIGMRQRAERIGATLEIRPSMSGGTVVALDWHTA